MLKGTYRFSVIPADMSLVRELPEDYVAPEPPPPHTITFTECAGIPVAIYESEHGKQIVGHFCYSTDTIRFTALAGTPGDEFFIYSMKISDGVLQGEAYQPNKPHSRLEGKLIS